MKKFPWFNNHEIFSKPFLEWVTYNLKENNQTWVEDWHIVFATTLWWVWKWRNLRCFNDNVDVPFDQYAFLMARVGEIKRAMVKEDLLLGKRKRGREMIFVRWLTPRMGWVKLNTDGASRGNPGNAGCGGLIRGPGGELHEVFAARCGSCSCTRAELLGVMRGLAVAWNAGHRRVQLSVDSMVVVQLRMDTTIPNSPFFHIIKKCRSMIRRHGWEVAIQHCYREANRAADWLANFGVDMEQRFHYFEAIPSDLRNVLLEDLSGMTIARIVSALAA